MEELDQSFELPDGAAAYGQALFVPDVKAKQLWILQTNKLSSPNAWRKASSAQAGYSGTACQLGHLYLADNAGQRIMRMQLGKGGKPAVFFEFQDGQRPNDLTVDSRGRVYVTLTKQGEVCRISADGSSVETICANVKTPNGLALSPDETRLYVSEYLPGNVVEVSLASDTLPVDAQPFVSDDALTKADGMCSDRAGNVYCAGETAVWIWNSSGELLDKIETPERPINCCFGGSHGTDLYISTFGGVVRLNMGAYGVQPNPPTDPKMQMKDRPSTALAGLTATLNQVYYREGSRKLLCDIIAPKDAPASQALRPAVVLVHGGGWLHGDKTKFRPLAIKLAKAGYVVMAVEYRLGHEADFPAGVRDCNAAVAFARLNAAQLGIDATKIAAVGGSAGGHIVGLMGSGFDEPRLAPMGIISNLGAATDGKPNLSTRPDAVVVMAGPLEITTGSVAERSQAGKVSNATQWLGDSIDKAPKLYDLADAYSKISAACPPMLFLTGSLDNPSRNDRSLAALRNAGLERSRKVIHEGARHGHWNQTAWMDQVVADIHEFLSDTL